MQFKNAGAILVAIILVGMISGCGAGPQPIEQASAEDVAKMKNLRTIFDSVHGDYNALSDAQKKQFVDYAKGDQNAATKIWAHMKDPRGNGTMSGVKRPFSVGPGGQILPPGGTEMPNGR